MASKTVKAKGGLLNKIMKAPERAGAGLATYLLKGLYIPKKGKRSGGAKRVKARK